LQYEGFWVVNFLNSGADPETKSSGKTAIEVVYASLRQAILDGEVEPGSRLQIEKLRKQHGVGSSTVREALSRLLVEKLVTTEGQRGFRVAPVSIEDFREIVQMRSLIESVALLEAMDNGKDDWEGEIVAAHYLLAKIENMITSGESDRVDEWETRNREFHNALYSACRNRWLQNFRDILYSQSVRYLRVSMTRHTIPRDVRAEHQALFDAVMARDKQLAKKLICAHIEKSLDVLEALVSQDPTGVISAGQ
jgi:GntR family transcriptional regulator, carbon starvation induced regulator